MTTVLSNAPDLVLEDYCVLGLASCFVKQEREIFNIKVIEPLPYAAIAALMKLTPTAYQMVIAKSLGEIFSGDNLEQIEEFPPEAQFCADFTQKIITATRSYKNTPHSKSLLPLGSTQTDFNLSLDKKRILDADHFVLDNIVPY